MTLSKKHIGHFLLAIALLGVACGSDEESSRAKLEPVRVSVQQAVIQGLGQQSVYTGTVEAVERVRLSTKIMGWIDAIPFQEGAHFQRGALLVKLRNKDLEAKRSQALAAVEEARTHFENTEKNLHRIEALFEQSAATEKERDDMRAAFASAKSNKIAAEKMAAEVDELLRYSEIAAPFTGVITRKMLQEGDLASPGQPVLEIEDASRIKVVAKVPEKDIQALEVGTPVMVSIEAAGTASNGLSPKSEIARIVPAADPQSRTFEIHVPLQNSDSAIKSGMFARVVVAGAGRTGLLIPEEAVLQRGQLDGIFVVDENSRATLRWIRPGGRWHGQIEVLSGLSEGERVIVSGQARLLDGQPVEVVQ